MTTPPPGQRIWLSTVVVSTVSCMLLVTAPTPAPTLASACTEPLPVHDAAHLGRNQASALRCITGESAGRVRWRRRALAGADR